MRKSKLFLLIWIMTSALVTYLDIAIGIIYLVSGILISFHHWSARKEYYKLNMKEAKYIG